MSGLSRSLSFSRSPCFFLCPKRGVHPLPLRPQNRRNRSTSANRIFWGQRSISKGPLLLIPPRRATYLNTRPSSLQSHRTFSYEGSPFVGRTVGIPQNVRYSRQKLKMLTTHRALDGTSIRLQKTFQSSPRIILRPTFRLSTLRRRSRSPCDGVPHKLLQTRAQSSSPLCLALAWHTLGQPRQTTG